MAAQYKLTAKNEMGNSNEKGKIPKGLIIMVPSLCEGRWPNSNDVRDALMRLGYDKAFATHYSNPAIWQCERVDK